MDETSESSTRRRILEFIETHPGASAREIQRSLSLGWGDTAYQLERLVTSSSLRRDRSTRRDYYFPNHSSLGERTVLVAFQSPAERAVLVSLSLHPGQSFRELASQLKMNKSNLSLHLRFLIRLNLVTVTGQYGVRRYYSADPARVLELYRKYRQSWGETWIDRFASAFVGLMPPV